MSSKNTTNKNLPISEQEYPQNPSTGLQQSVNYLLDDMQMDIEEAIELASEDSLIKLVQGLE